MNSIAVGIRRSRLYVLTFQVTSKIYI